MPRPRTIIMLRYPGPAWRAGSRFDSRTQGPPEVAQFKSIDAAMQWMSSWNLVELGDDQRAYVACVNRMLYPVTHLTAENVVRRHLPGSWLDIVRSCGWYCPIGHDEPKLRNRVEAVMEPLIVEGVVIRGPVRTNQGILGSPIYYRREKK